METGSFAGPVLPSGHRLEDGAHQLGQPFCGHVASPGQRHRKRRGSWIKIEVGTPKNHKRRAVPFPEFLGDLLANQCEGKPVTHACSQRATEITCAQPVCLWTGKAGSVAQSYNPVSRAYHRMICGTRRQVWQTAPGLTSRPCKECFATAAPP